VLKIDLFIHLQEGNVVARIDVLRQILLKFISSNLCAKKARVFSPGQPSLPSPTFVSKADEVKTWVGT
jgi:hypothetical protein